LTNEHLLSTLDNLIAYTNRRVTKTTEVQGQSKQEGERNDGRTFGSKNQD
jgi:hypothetical protein